MYTQITIALVALLLGLFIGIRYYEARERRIRLEQKKKKDAETQNLDREGNKN